MYKLTPKKKGESESAYKKRNNDLLAEIVNIAIKVPRKKGESVDSYNNRVSATVDDRIQTYIERKEAEKAEKAKKRQRKVNYITIVEVIPYSLEKSNRGDIKSASQLPSFPNIGSNPKNFLKENPGKYKIDKKPGIILTYKGKKSIADLKIDLDVNGYPRFAYDVKIQVNPYRNSRIKNIKRYFTNQTRTGTHDIESSGDCVVKILEKHCTNKRLKKVNVLKELKLKNRFAGVTIKQLEEFAKKFEIRLGIVDASFNIITNLKSDKRELGLYLVAVDKHLYYLNKDQQSIFSKKTSDIHIDKYVKLECKLCKITFQDRDLMYRHNLSHSKKKITTIPDIKTALTTYVEATNNIPMISKDLTSFYDDKNIFITKGNKFTYEDQSANTIAKLGKLLFQKSFPNAISYFNKYTREIFYGDVPLPCVEFYKKMDKPFCYQYDMNKCYAGIMSNYDLPVFDGLETPEPYRKVKGPHFVYKDGWFANTVKVDSPTHILVPNSYIKKEELSKFISDIYNSEFKHKKELLNFLTGNFRKTHSTSNGIPVIVKHLHDKNYYYKLGCKPSLQFLEYSVYQRETTTPCFASYIPIYNYIIQTGRSIMMNAKSHIESLGGQVYAIKTDAIFTDIQVDLTPLSTSSIIGNWKMEKKTFVYGTTYRRYGFGKLPILPEIKTTYYNGIPDDSCFVTGMPGCGKSYEVNKFKSKVDSILELSFQNNVVSDMSNTAMTFHKMLGIQSNGKITSDIQKTKKYNYIFIDEFQMTPVNIIPYLTLIKDLYNCKFIISGDFNQWGAIGKSLSPDNYIVRSLFNGNIWHIKGNKRILNNIYVKALEGFNFEIAIKQTTYKLDTKYNITYYSESNHTQSSKNLNKRLYEKFTNLIWKKEFTLKNGVPLICTKSNKKLNLIKGKHYIYNDNKIIDDPHFHKTKSIIKIDKKTTYEHLDLGYAFSCHKSIGATITAPYTIYKGDLKNNLAEHVYKTFLYVALSRCTDPKFVRVL